MDFELDEVQAAVQATARAFAREKLAPGAGARDRAERFAVEETRALAGLGLDALGQDVEDFRHLWVAFGIAARRRPSAPEAS